MHLSTTIIKLRHSVYLLCGNLDLPCQVKSELIKPEHYLNKDPPAKPGVFNVSRSKRLRGR